MRTVLTALATTLMFFSGSLCEGAPCNLDTETLALPAEESESDSRTRYPSSERGWVKAKSREMARRTGNRTFEELREKRPLAVARLHETGCCTAETGLIQENRGHDNECMDSKVAGYRMQPADKDAVIIDRDLRVSRINAERKGGPPGSAKYHAEYTISVDVDNKGDRGKVLIILAGKGRDGREIGSVLLKDVLHGNESKTLLATAALTSLKSREIETWEVFRAYKLC
jgi:hypothetical protein